MLSDEILNLLRTEINLEVHAFYKKLNNPVMDIRRFDVSLHNRLLRICPELIYFDFSRTFHKTSNIDTHYFLINNKLFHTYTRLTPRFMR